VLVRENRQGRWLKEALSPVCREHEITIIEVSESDRRSHVPAEVFAMLQFLDRPHSPDYLKAALEVLVQRQLIPPQDLTLSLLYLSVPLFWTFRSTQSEPAKSRYFCRSLLRARMELPQYQLISFRALDLKLRPSRYLPLLVQMAEGGSTDSWKYCDHCDSQCIK
jgi:DNA helicase-2/ATP-dependent DNA helicase PcrA